MKLLFTVKGKVQGVGYRKFVKYAAISNHIIGAVRNLDNGDVEVFADGDQENINSFFKEISNPGIANITSITKHEEGCEGYSESWIEYGENFILC